MSWWWRDRWAIANQGHQQKGICYLTGNNPRPKQWFNTASIQRAKFYQLNASKFCLIASLMNQDVNFVLAAFFRYSTYSGLGTIWPLQDKQGLTAAQRLGVTEQPLTLKQLLS